MSDSVPLIVCPKPYNLTMDPSSESSFLHFTNVTHPVEIYGVNQSVILTYSPSQVKVLPNDYINVTVKVVDSRIMSASCTFQVFVLPAVCSDKSLAVPDNAFVECNQKDGKNSCLVACNAGFLFIDGATKEYVCEPQSGWTPGPFVPDCVPSGKFIRNVFAINMIILEPVRQRSSDVRTVRRGRFSPFFTSE